MHPDFSQNCFELFGLPATFEVDAEALALRYRELQRAAHPDRYAGGSDQERRLAVQMAARINEAFRTLKDPLARARYLLELKGAPLDEHETAMDPQFLMEQMELREALAEVRDATEPFDRLADVRTDLEQRERELVMELQSLFDDSSAQALDAAGETVRKLQFMNKLLDEAAAIEEDLVHES